MERTTKEPLVPFEEELRTQLKHERRLHLYFNQREGGGFDLYVSRRRTRKGLAIALPQNRISPAALEAQRQAEFLNVPLIPLPRRGEDPTNETLARQVFVDFIPRFFPFAEGKPIDFYRFDQHPSREKPAVRICFRGNSMIITHPNQESAGNS